MRFFVSGPRIMGLRFGAIFGRRELAALFPMWLWRVPIYVVLALATVGSILFVADFVRYLPR